MVELNTCQFCVVVVHQKEQRPRGLYRDQCRKWTGPLKNILQILAQKVNDFSPKSKDCGAAQPLRCTKTIDEITLTKTIKKDGVCQSGGRRKGGMHRAEGKGECGRGAAADAALRTGECV